LNNALTFKRYFMTVASIPSSDAGKEEKAKISEQELSSIAGGQQIPEKQLEIWEAMLRDPSTPPDVRKRIADRVTGRPVDGKHHDGSIPT
jgi:hypothetical protein